MSFDIGDAYESNVESSCCGGGVLIGDMCATCGEHCSVYDTKIDKEFDTTEERNNYEKFS